MNELKPCPFCGSPEVKMYSFEDASLHGFLHLCKTNGDAMVKIESRLYSTEEKAIEAWNRRAGEQNERANETNSIDRGNSSNNSNDMIYRQAALDAIHCNITVTGRQNAELVAATMGAFADRIKALPSVQPQYKPVTAEEFSKMMSKNTVYDFMAWHHEAITLMNEMGFVICKKAM